MQSVETRLYFLNSFLRRSLRISYSRVSQLFFLHGEAATGTGCNLQLKEKFVLRRLVRFSTKETSEDTVHGDGAHDFLYALTLRPGITCLGAMCSRLGVEKEEASVSVLSFQPPVSTAAAVSSEP